MQDEYKGAEDEIQADSRQAQEEPRNVRNRPSSLTSCCWTAL